MSIRVWEFLRRPLQDFAMYREKTGTNHQNRERTRTEVMCAKHPNSSSLVLFIFPSLIFSSIYTTFTVTEVPTLIFVLFRFPFFLLFAIVPTGKLLVDFGEVISNCSSNSRVCCQTVFSTKNRSQQKIAGALRTNNSSLSE